MPYEDDPLPRRPAPVIPRRIPAWNAPGRETLRRVAAALRALPYLAPGHECRGMAPYEPRHGPPRLDAGGRE